MDKELTYSLRNGENYKQELETEPILIVKKVSELILEYFKFISENMKLKNSNFSKFIIIRGLDTLTSVFNFILLYTKNIDVTYFHCQKAFYFYIEFVSQISEDEKMFLQLSSRDASTYVYKKTIFEINYNKPFVATDYTKQKIGNINYFVELYKTLILKLIDDDIGNKHNLLLLENLYHKLSILTGKIDLGKLTKMIDNLFYNIRNVTHMYKLLDILLQKIIKKPEKINNINDKFINKDYLDNLHNLNNTDNLNNIDKTALWLIS